MNIHHGTGATAYGPGVDIHLTAEDVALAILEFVEVRGVTINGPRTITFNGEPCRSATIYVDPSGTVVSPKAFLCGDGSATIYRDEDEA